MLLIRTGIPILLFLCFLLCRVIWIYLFGWMHRMHRPLLNPIIRLVNGRIRVGINYHASQSKSANQPTLELNSIYGKPSIYFDGSNDSLSGNSRLGLSVNPTVSIFVICEVASLVTGADTIFQIGHNKKYLAVFGGTGKWSWRHSDGNKIFGNVSTNTSLLLCFIRSNGSKYGSSRFYLNGTQQVHTSIANGESFPTDSSSSYHIGFNKWNNSNYSHGRFGEIIVTNSDSDNNRQLIETYLAFKWGLENNLPTDYALESTFKIDSNGTLKLNQTLDYESDNNLTITVRAKDDDNASFDKNFTISVTNVIEDLDGDGTEDHYDDDIDGDGLTNADELAYNSDPWDASSSNRPPSDINASNLTIAENSAIGTVIGEFNATDPDGEGNFTFSLYPLLPNSPSLWLDGVDINGDGQADGLQVDDNVSLWVDKSGNGYDFNETHGQPTYSNKDGLGVVKFDGQSIIWTGKSLYPDFSNYTILSVSRYTGGANRRVISDVDANNWLFGYHDGGVGGRIDCFYANGWLTSNRDQLDQNWHLHVGTMNDSDYGQGWVDQTIMVDTPTGAGSPHQPKLLALGGGRWSTTSGLSEMSAAEVAELIVFDRVLDASKIAQAENYLIGKWKLPLTMQNPNNALFSMDANGTLTTTQTYDYETDDQNYTVTVWATDDHGASFDKNFTITVTNVVEDLDGDGTEDHYDDDIDGDGLTNVEELLYNSDPWDASSNNRPPSDINASNLAIAENSAIGTVIGEFNATDPDGEGNFTFSVQSVFADPSKYQRFECLV